MAQCYTDTFLAELQQSRCLNFELDPLTLPRVIDDPVVFQDLVDFEHSLLAAIRRLWACGGDFELFRIVRLLHVQNPQDNDLQG